jgi:hypothetical protein
MFLFVLSAVSPAVFPQTLPLTRQEISRDLLSATPPIPSMQQTDEAQAPSRKAVGLAALYSLLLPGMGELYAEGFSSGKYFLMAEGGLWITYALFEIHGNDLRDGARAFAAARGGVTVNGKDDQFFVDIGNFLSMDDYNDKRLRDREPERLYSIEGGQYWLWDSEDSRLTYREQRIASDRSYNNRKFVGAAILVNHVISAINAARAAIAYNNSLEQSLGTLELSSRVLGVPGQEHGVLVTLTKSF